MEQPGKDDIYKTQDSSAEPEQDSADPLREQAVDLSEEEEALGEVELPDWAKPGAVPTGEDDEVTAASEADFAEEVDFPEDAGEFMMGGIEHAEGDPPLEPGNSVPPFPVPVAEPVDAAEAASEDSYGDEDMGEINFGEALNIGDDGNLLDGLGDSAFDEGGRSDAYLLDAEKLLQEQAQKITELNTELEQKAEDLESLKRSLEEREARVADRERTLKERESQSPFLRRLPLKPDFPKTLEAMLGTWSADTALNFSEGAPQYWFKEISEALAYNLERLQALMILDGLQKGQRALKNEPFSMEDLVSGLRLHLQRLAGDDGCELIARMKKSVPERLKGDRELVHHVLCFIIDNLVKQRRLRLLHLSIAPDEMERSNDQMVQLIFSFNDFEHAEGERHSLREDSENPESSLRLPGDPLPRPVGLALADRLGALAGGYLWIEEEMGTGTSLCVTLPFDLPTEPRIE
ncbi:MAG: hypothetical protein ACOCVG_02585 [Verrucomicrobiota bacterium]